MRGDRYDFDKIIQWSIKGQTEVIRALSILAEARIDRHADFLASRVDTRRLLP